MQSMKFLKRGLKKRSHVKMQQQQIIIKFWTCQIWHDACSRILDSIISVQGSELQMVPKYIRKALDSGVAVRLSNPGHVAST